MKKVRVEDAVGMTLCHDLTEMREGFKGPAFRRGHVITREDIPHMLNIGKQHVFVWEENTGEIHEEDAALRLAALMPLDGTHREGPSEGKILIISDTDGLFRVNVPLLSRLNHIGDITVSTLPDHYPVSPGMRLASMRIVPLVTQESQIVEAERLCAGERLLDLFPYRPLKVGVVITGAEVYSGRVKDMFEPICRAKLAHYPGEVAGVTLCDDDLDMLLG
ncbi:MAG: molybdopterin-binding protein, partial [Fretibacterium sp.]|nr:molybdopterin-binding protein [Fretibacterium sp.]